VAANFTPSTVTIETNQTTDQVVNQTNLTTAFEGVVVTDVTQANVTTTDN